MARKGASEEWKASSRLTPGETVDIRDKKSPEGLWKALDEMEGFARRLLKPVLAPFEEALRICYEAGVQAPTLKAKRHQEADILCASLFLKRMLNDLRAVWLQLRTGYTSQGASVAASLWENALAVTCIAGNAANATLLTSRPGGDLPWKPETLAKMVTKRRQEGAHSRGEEFSESEYEEGWRQVYSAYKWLCQVKHPTLPSAMHDAFAASVREGEYVVMAAPDPREADLPVKATILAISLGRTLDALEAFADSMQCNEDETTYQEFQVRLRAAEAAGLTAYKAFHSSSLPFNIGGTPFGREWNRLRRSKRPD